MLTRRKFGQLLARASLAFALVFGAPAAHAAQNGGSDSTQGSDINPVPNSETVRINRFSFCRDVTGQMRNSVMVPARSKDEWAAGEESFIESGAKGTSLRPCIGRYTQPKSGDFCAYRSGAWIRFGVSGVTSTGSPNVPNPSFKSSRTGKFLVGYIKSGATALYLTGNGGPGNLSPQQTADKNYIHVPRGFPTGGQYVFSPDDTMMALSKPAKLDWGKRMRKGPNWVTIYDIVRPGSFYNVSNPRSVNIGNASGNGKTGIDYSLVAFDLNGDLFTVKSEFSQSCNFSNCTRNVYQKTLEIRTAASGYAIVQSMVLPPGRDPQVSDDGTEIMVSDSSKLEALTYVRDASTGQFTLSQTIKESGGLLVPTMMAPGGTVAIGTKAGTPDRVWVHHGWFSGWADKESWNGQITVYRKEFPDDPTWTVALNSTNASYKIGHGTLSPDGEEILFPSVSDTVSYSTRDLSIADIGPGTWGTIAGKLQNGGSSSATYGGCGGNCGSQTTHWKWWAYYKCN